MNKKWFPHIFFFIILAALLWWVLRNVPVVQIWNNINQLKIWQLGVLLIVNSIIYGLITLRWWIILYAENKKIKYAPLILARMAVFGVSYFTLGPHVGGEPLQVLYLQKKQGLSYTRATASVWMDKLLELFANFMMLMFGVAAILQAGIVSNSGIRLQLSLSALVFLGALPVVYLILLHRGQFPVSAFVKLFQKNKTTRFISASEKLAGMFCQRHLASLTLAVLVSIVAGVVMVLEFGLIISFLNIKISVWQTIAAWTVGWLSALVPLPGALGALEASQVFSLGLFGVSSALAISVVMLMRARDILFGGLGLLISGSVVNSSK